MFSQQEKEAVCRTGAAVIVNFHAPYSMDKDIALSLLFSLDLFVKGLGLP